MIDHLQATYHDLKTVKTRDSVQLILELPMASLPSVIELLGPPVSGESVWVVVARIREPQAVTPAIEQQPEPEDKPKSPARMSQSAGIICGEGAFATFMRDVKGYAFDCEPAQALRLYCGIESRRELDDTVNSSARSNFISLRSEYEAWLKCDDGIVRRELA